VRNCAKLELLNLSNNHLQSLPADIGHLINLKHLDLFKNQLTSVPSTIGTYAATHRADSCNVVIGKSASDDQDGMPHATIIA
jgi:Leucine-rich repeat (LRR) protein